MANIWEDVRWNHQAADEAINALLRAAEELERTIAERSAAVRRVRAEFRGPHRDRFDVTFEQMQRRAAELARAYRDAAHRIRQASEWARAEQRRREREREMERERERMQSGQG